ncbi:hypothetical protein NPIL_494791 [Nephila pilipes]|uniref:Uncharacterized protein n=1 Tax=Nephila pilipes TaxID=299642 RepID=A0A8X6MUU0_NEPPI|nr:hypothetical protein NPIL_494791 [Nephila pilipes]
MANTCWWRASFNVNNDIGLSRPTYDFKDLHDQKSYGVRLGDLGGHIALHSLLYGKPVYLETSCVLNSPCAGASDIDCIVCTAQDNAEGRPLLGQGAKEPVASNFCIILLNVEYVSSPLPSCILCIQR